VARGHSAYVRTAEPYDSKWGTTVSVLRESTMALTESVGVLISSVPLHEDRGRKAAESLTPVPGAYPVTGDRPALWWLFVDWIVPCARRPPCVISDTRLT